MTYIQDQQAAWKETLVRFPDYEKWVKADIDKMKAEYTAKYGYALLIPNFDDIVHYEPDAWMSESDRLERKRRNLYRILASPTPAWVSAYSSVMCWIDNIQDAMTTGLVLSLALRKWLPRLFARAVPLLGWGLMGYDLLNLLVSVGRTPFSPMKSKRAMCEIVRTNPFSKKAKRSRQKRLWTMKPGFGAATEVLQTTDWLFGVGLSLGSIFSTLTDSAFMHYRQLTGENVRVLTEPPVHEMLDITGFKSLQAAAMISSAGQVFDDDLHFWSYVTFAGTALLVAPTIHDDPPEEYYEDPMNVLIPAPEPTNPETIAVIKAAGLDVQEGVRWPANEAKEISLDVLSDWQAVNSRDAITSYMFRHMHDWNGFVAAGFLEQAISHLLGAVDPGAEVEEEYTPIVHVTLQLLKHGITPIDETQVEQWAAFEQWCEDYRVTTRSWPTVEEIKTHLEIYGVSFQTSFPKDQDPRAADVFPEESLSEALWEETYEM